MSCPRKDSGWVMVESTPKHDSAIERLSITRKKTLEATRAIIDGGDSNFLSMHVSRSAETGVVSDLVLALVSSEKISQIIDGDSLRQSTLEQWAAIFKLETKIFKTRDQLQQSGQFRLFGSRGNLDVSTDWEDTSDWLSEIVDFLQLASTQKKIILVGFDLRDTLNAIRDDWPSLMGHFSDAIDLWSILHSATPTGTPIQNRVDVLCALGLNKTFCTNVNTSETLDPGNAAISNLAILYEFRHLTTQQAAGLGLSNPQGSMKPRPYLEFSKTRGQTEDMYIAEIRTRCLEAMPDKIDSTLKLADFIMEHGYNPIKIGTSGRRWRWGECSSFRGIGITQTQREEGWVCFADHTAVEIFVDEMNDMIIEGVTLDVRSIV